MIGYLKVNILTAEGMLPIKGAAVDIKDKKGNILYHAESDANGNVGIFELEAPDVALTLDQSYREPAYSTYDVGVHTIGFRDINIYNVEIVATATAVLDVNQHPETEENSFIPSAESSSNSEVQVAAVPAGMSAQAADPENIIIPPLGLLLPVDQQQFTTSYQSIRQVYIPEYITVHLGRPQDTGAQNVKVSFIDYVANVASSEIYPTWPYNSLVANIHCIVTFAINRVYTEWYRGRGFNFDITNSTSYDQYFVYGRNIFENIREIAANVFNVYARRFGFRNPFFTEYCNGTTVTCRGLSQWGTVALANQGLSPLQILRYYYPDDLELIGTDNIMGIQQTYPGTALRIGSTGPYVQKMQVYLNRIRANFPLIPAIPNPNGVFDEATDIAVRTFQRTFSLVSDGIIGKATWNSISFTYIGIVKLAELDSEGERVNIGQTPPSVVLRLGSRGVYVLEAQFILNYIAAYYESIPYVIQDNIYDENTANAVIQFQKTFSMVQDGIIGPATWRKLYSVFHSIQDHAPVPPTVAPPAGTRPPFPGRLLRVGSTGNDVSTMQRFLNTIRTVYTSIEPQLLVDGVFGNNTRRAVVTFQQQFLLVPDGIIGPLTWNKIVEMYNVVTGGVV